MSYQLSSRLARSGKSNKLLYMINRRNFNSTSKLNLKVVNYDAHTITVSELGSDSPNSVSFRNLFLRDACSDPSSVDVSSGQKSFSTGQLPSDIQASDVEVVKTGAGSEPALQVQWNDGHSSIYTQSFLKQYSSLKTSRERRLLDKDIWLWPSNAGSERLNSEIMHIPFETYMNDELQFSHAVQSLHRNGLIFVTDIPQQNGIVENTTAEKPTIEANSTVLVEEIAGRIGYIKQTFYGPSWDVVSVPNAKNVAYTSVYLPLHMDLLYYESPPGVQLLHVISNSTTGGESVFADSFRAAYHVLETDPKAYDALTKVPITFHYDNDGFHYYQSRPLIVEDPYSDIDPIHGRKSIYVVNYSPPFQGPLDSIATTDSLDAQLVADFHRGLKLFEAFIDETSNQIEVKMKPNTCMVFMNRRTLHGRRQFSSDTGKRWFRGTYLDIDSFHSKLRTSSVLIEGSKTERG